MVTNPRSSTDVDEKSEGVSLHERPVVYISNLPYEATAPDLQRVFDKEGLDVVHIEFIKKGKPERLQSAGLACVTLATADEVKTTCQKLDGKQIYNRAMVVKEGKFE
ncbi:hypothetical protein BSKO_02068 [Bryopsis sp. KO-2023]|nr:hypothetical protein BSKO_02068 [Bryopsis sp. KO-2023]